MLVYVKVNKKQRRQACLKAFETLYKQWVTFNRKFKKYYTSKNIQAYKHYTGIVPFMVYRDLFKQATKELKVTKHNLPS